MNKLSKNIQYFAVFYLLNFPTHAGMLWQILVAQVVIPKLSAAKIDELKKLKIYMSYT